jgi:riboflavin synthase
VFTGIVRHVGTVQTAADADGRRKVSVACGPLATDLRAGDSVAVAGACLTAAEVSAAVATFDVGGETLARTTLGRLAPGERVNLERALRVGDRLDGHLVQGHVEGTAEVAEIRRGEPWTLVLSAGPELIAQMVPKGSVAVDGVSLTLVEVTGGRFSVALIPTTLADTTLGDLSVGEAVNIETDLLGKYVRRYLEGLSPSAGGLTLEKLREAGFA